MLNHLLKFLVPSIYFQNWFSPSLGGVASVVGIANGVSNLLGGGGGGGGGAAPGQGGSGGSSGSSGSGSSGSNIPPSLVAGLTQSIPMGINLGGHFGSTEPMYNTDVGLGYAAGGNVDFTPHLTQGNSNLSLKPGFHSLQSVMPSIETHFAEGGHAEAEHIPEFYSEGGLKHTYVQGDGDGTSDSVPAMLANGEFVIPADVVSSLGNGSNDSGSKVLDEFLQVIREHKHTHGSHELPPDSKGPLNYLVDASKKVEK